MALRTPGPGLEDGRVEITGPTDRKMVINAMNSGSKTFMADFEGELLAFCPGGGRGGWDGPGRSLWFGERARVDGRG